MYLKYLEIHDLKLFGEMGKLKEQDKGQGTVMIIAGSIIKT